MALIYLMHPWTSTNAENFETSRVNYISKISKNDPIQHIYGPIWTTFMFALTDYTQISHNYDGWGHFWHFWICNSPWKF